MKTTLLIFFAAGVIAAGFLFYTRGTALKIPRIRIDYRNIEPRVAAKLQRLIQDTEQKPENADNWGKLAMTLDVHGFNQEAITCYEQASRNNPHDFRWHYFWAIALKEQGSADALSRFEMAVKHKPDYLPLVIRYARVLFEAGRLTEAESQFRKALQLAPTSAEAYLGLAQIALQENDVQASKRYAEQAVASSSKYGEAYNLLSIIYRRLEQPQKAAEALSRARALAQTSGFVDPLHSTLVAEGESAFWYRTRGRTYMESGLYLLAVREFKTALQLQPDADAYDNLGAALQALGKWEEALLYHRKAVEISPDHLKYYNLGIAYGRLNRISDAINTLQKSIDLKQDQPEAFYNLGVAHFKSANWTQAKDALKAAIRLNPSHEDAHHALAMVYLETGERSEAIEWMKRLEKLDPHLAKQLQIRLR